MDERLRFLLYGTYDGFSRSILGDDNLYLVLENGEKVEVPRCFVKNASDFIEKDKLKLKDVIARIKKLDLGTQEVWLNEILNELGGDYGLLKLINQLDGPQKPVVKQFVADWYEECKDNLEYNIWSYIYNWERKEGSAFKDWIDTGRNKPIQTLVNMHQFGYTVEKEKRYLVKMKRTDKEFTMLKLDKIRGSWYLGNDTEYSYTKTTHTLKELEQAGFGEVFNSPLFEVEEVEE